MRLGHRHKQRAPEMRSLVAPGPQRRGEKWLQRFRKCWNLLLGSLPAKDVLPTATMQAKARSEFSPQKIAVAPPLSQFWGP